MIMRASFVLDSDENIMQFVDGLRLSIRRRINLNKMRSLKEAYYLSLRAEEGQLKRYIERKQRGEK